MCPDCEREMAELTRKGEALCCQNGNLLVDIANLKRDGAERERKARLQEMIALPVHAWPDNGETYPQEWGAELVKYRNERIRALSTSAPAGEEKK